MPTLTLLGPQRLHPIVATTLRRLPSLRESGSDQAVAVVTAGWQEREAEVDELQEHVHRPVSNLRLYERAERVLQDGDLFLAHRQRQDRLKELRQLYQLRLRHAMTAARALISRDGDDDLLEPERQEAVAAVRRLDQHHLDRVQEVHGEFHDAWGDALLEETRADREELRAILSGSAALCIAGGHVTVLLNRLRLFGLDQLLRELPNLPVIAWSAGAMVMTSRVVLFHDRPPQGFGNAEVFEHGLGLAPRVVALPHASNRLRLQDPVRVGLLARRLAPARCITLDAGNRVTWNGKRWRAAGGTLRLTEAGTVEEAFAR